MKDDRSINAAIEVWNCDRLSRDDFLHYAYVAKLLHPDRYREWCRRQRDPVESTCVEGMQEGAVEEMQVDAIWSLEGIPEGEGSYLLRELRLQLGRSISELHAFRDEIRMESEIINRPEYPGIDDNGPQSWTQRPTSVEDVLAERGQASVFPRNLNGYLVVPAPPETAEG